MAKLLLKQGSTDVTLYVFVNDSTSTTGAGKTGLVYNSAGMTASYVRPLGARQALSLATQTVTGAHSDGGFVEVDATNMPGVYRLDLPDAVCATGAVNAVVFMHGATGMAPLVLELELSAIDVRSLMDFGLLAKGTLSGTHTTTTSDLGANAPTYDVAGATLLVSGRPARIVTSYNTGTGVATFDAISSAGTDGLDWVLIGTPPGALSGSLPTVNVVQISGDSVAADTLELFAEALDQATGQLDSGSLAAGTITAASVASAALPASKFDAANPVPANAVQISGDSVAADNLESYTDGTTPMPVNVAQISGDATAADNLETYTDGTDRMPVDVREINSAVVNGNGTSGTPWTGA